MIAKNAILNIINNDLYSKIISFDSNVDKTIPKYVLNSLSQSLTASIDIETLSNVSIDLDYSEFDTYLASEDSLKDWLSPEEDEAWKDL